MSAGSPGQDEVSAAVRAQAAAWVARLHGPNRSKEVEAGLRRWLADDPRHPVAFELLTDTWDRSARLKPRPIEQVKRWELVGFRLSVSRAVAAAAAIAVVAVIGTILYLHSDVVSTGNGELRILTLQDGTRVHMNSDTRLMVRYGPSVRNVYLDDGEAFFEVAKNPKWPFVVTAGAHRIRALGTEFDVRDEARALSVTLVQGKVTVSPVASDRDADLVPNQGGAVGATDLPRAQSRTVTLSPGERVTYAAVGGARVDKPSLDLVTAWERGQVVLENMSLAEAAAEMNRYSRQRIIVEDPAAASSRVSGIFEAGDSANFAAAVASAYHLKVMTRQDGTIFLESAGTPRTLRP